MRVVLCVAAALVASPALADHGKDRLDELMAEKEPGFEATDVWHSPELAVVDGAGDPLDRDDLSERIVVLSIVSDGCGAACTAQQAVLAEVREAVNITPMRDMVTFVAVAQADVGGGKPIAPNLVTVRPADSTTVASLAARYADLSSRVEVNPQTHVIGRGGRHAGIFHGVEFGYVDAVFHINGLTNARPSEPGLLDRVSGFLR